MPNSIGAFSLCAGWQGTCPWKTAMTLALDSSSGRLCPFCSADSLTAARASRSGQDITQALLRIRALDAAAYEIALERLDRFGNAATRADYESRVERAVSRQERRALRRPAAAPAAGEAALENDS